jgi:c-di-GMP-binding flagellar brake protein YcgR
MSSVTLPMPIDGPGVASGRFDQFRVHSAIEIRGLLARIVEGNVLLHLSAPDGAVYTTTLWALDAQRGVVSFAVDPVSPQLQRVLAADEITVVGYIDNVKLQFDLHGAMLVSGARASALNAPIPRELFRFQRRASFRIKPLAGSAATASFMHPAVADLALSLRVLDVSIGGIALFLPDELPAIAPGSRLRGVQVELDADTRIEAGLVLNHVTAINPDAHGARLGCGWSGLGSEAERTLQLFVDQTQKRKRLLG